MPSNQYIPMTRGRYIAWCYKSGSGAIRYATQWSRTRPHAPAWEVAEATRERGAECVLFLRHPLARLRSCYRFFSERRSFPQRIYGKQPSWERFIDLVLQDRPETRNPHWDPQCETHTYLGVFLPTVTLPFEEIDQHWADWCPTPLEPRNVTGGGKEPLPGYRIDELEAYYHEDLVRWYAAVEGL